MKYPEICITLTCKILHLQFYLILKVAYTTEQALLNFIFSVLLWKGSKKHAQIKPIVRKAFYL